MFFDSALAFVCFEFQALLRVSEQPAQDFAAVLLFVAVRGGGRSRNVTLSVSCVPQMFIFSFVQEKNHIEIRSVCACDKVFLRTSAQMQYCRAIFSRLLSL